MPTARKPLPIWAILLMGALVIAVALGGVYAVSRPGHSKAMTVESKLPENIEQPVWMPNAAPSLKQAYAFAATHHDVLRYIPCYCGCNGQHKDNFECYWKHDGNGNPTEYEEHAYGCTVCQEITLQVIKGLDAGKSLEKIRAEVDAKYKDQALTPTPTPPVPKL